jgi:hypothetical protein
MLTGLNQNLERYENLRKIHIDDGIAHNSKITKHDSGEAIPLLPEGGEYGFPAIVLS